MSTPPRRFPRPMSSTSLSHNSRVSAHITSATSQRPPSPLKQQIRAPSPSSDPSILPTPGGSGILAKVYGSLLQRPETLATYSCSSCDARFQPDQTIYPAPGAPTEDQFLCKSCFSQNGGSIGSCASCSREVLRLKAEGSWVENGGRVWHSRCFNCVGCGMDLSDRPTVDLLGQPSCEGCFDTCLSRNTPTNRHSSPRVINRTPTNNTPKTGNIGGMRPPSSKSQENSPVVDELARRIGVAKSREGTPTSKNDSPLASKVGGIRSPGASPAGSGKYTPRDRDDSPIAQRIKNRLSNPRLSLSSSPKSTSTSATLAAAGLRAPLGSPALGLGGASSSDTISSISSRGSYSSLAPSLDSTLTSMSGSPLTDTFEFGKTVINNSTPPLRRIGSTPTIRPEEPKRASPAPPSSIPRRVLPPISTATSYQSQAQTPAAKVLSRLPLAKSVGPSSLPPAPPAPKSESSSSISTTTSHPAPSKTSKRSLHPDPKEPCLSCGEPLFNIAGGGRIVSLPPPAGEDQGENYHEACFRCSACHRSFADEDGRAVFIREAGKPIHVEVRTFLCVSNL